MRPNPAQNTNRQVRGRTHIIPEILYQTIFAIFASTSYKRNTNGQVGGQDAHYSGNIIRIHLYLQFVRPHTEQGIPMDRFRQDAHFWLFSIFLMQFNNLEFTNYYDIFKYCFL